MLLHFIAEFLKEMVVLEVKKMKFQRQCQLKKNLKKWEKIESSCSNVLLVVL